MLAQTHSVFGIFLTLIILAVFGVQDIRISAISEPEGRLFLIPHLRFFRL
jgi:hypothetical protein